jgi:hypothetical protein
MLNSVIVRQRKRFFPLHNLFCCTEFSPFAHLVLVVLSRSSLALYTVWIRLLAWSSVILLLMYGWMYWLILTESGIELLSSILFCVFFTYSSRIFDACEGEFVPCLSVVSAELIKLLLQICLTYCSTSYKLDDREWSFVLHNFGPAVKGAAVHTVLSTVLSTLFNLRCTMRCLTLNSTGILHCAGVWNWDFESVAYPGIFFGGVQQIQLRIEDRTGIWGR